MRKTERIILHSDMNNFYASVECLYHPEIRGRPVAVGGSTEKRHGIVLAKNNLAKAAGVKTGEAIWQARQKCPELVFVSPDFELYLRFSAMAREIYSDYTDRVESFGLDECWLDVTDGNPPDSGIIIADEIRERLKSELGVTVSVGVSFNKIFAKLGSDMKKPDATTEITRENFRTKVWPLPVNELLYVGPATYRKFRNSGIYTIGNLAEADKGFLEQILGKNGVMLWYFANGMDTSPVTHSDFSHTVKSIGNSITTPYDLSEEKDIKLLLYILCESVSARMREQKFRCRTVQITVRDEKLFSFERQIALNEPSFLTRDLFCGALALYKNHVPSDVTIRSLGVRACNLTADVNHQLSFFPEALISQKQEDLEYAIDKIRYRFGHSSVKRGIMLTNPRLSGVNPKEEHIIYPAGFLH